MRAYSAARWTVNDYPESAMKESAECAAQCQRHFTAQLNDVEAAWQSTCLLSGRCDDRAIYCAVNVSIEYRATTKCSDVVDLGVCRCARAVCSELASGQRNKGVRAVAREMHCVVTLCLEQKCRYSRARPRRRHTWSIMKK